MCQKALIYVYIFRFVSSDYFSFSPDHAITPNGPIDFTLPPLRSQSVYRMNQLVCSLRVKLTTRAGEALPSTSKTALANNSLNSLFKTSMVTLNGVPVNSSGSYHYLKSGLIT